MTNQPTRADCPIERHEMKTHDWPKALDTRIQQVMKLEHHEHADKALVGVAFILQHIERETA